MRGKKEWTCWRKGACDFQVTAFWFWKKKNCKTLQLCECNVSQDARDLRTFGKRRWPWTRPLTLNDAVLQCIKELPLFQVVISGRSQWKRENKYCTSLNITKACKNPEELGECGLRVQLRLGRWQADFARPRQSHVFLRLWLSLSFFCQTQRWSACSSQWRKSWRDSTARARKATTRWGRRDFTLSVWFAVFEHESRSILISAKHSQTQKQVRRKQSLSKVASDLFCFFSYLAAAEHYWS